MPAPKVAAAPRTAGHVSSPTRAEPHASGAAATFVVTSVNDSPLNSPTSKKCVDAESPHVCSLRAAVQAANNLDRSVLIKLAARTYTLTDGGLGALTVTNAGGTSIEGVGATRTKIVVPAANGYGAIYVADGANHAGSTLYLTGLRVTGGAQTTGGGIQSEAESNISIVLDHVTVAGNHVTSNGGGIYLYYASLWATDSSISDNVAAGIGGGIYNYWGNLYLTDDQVNSNTALDNAGGGIYQEYGNLHVVGGSVSGDTAGTNVTSGNGGGVFDIYGAVYLSGGVSVSHDSVLNDGTGGGEFEDSGALVATGASFSYDKAVGGTDAAGGGIYAEYGNHLTLDAVTMAHNTTSATTATYGGGAVYVDGYEYATTVTIGQGSSFTDNGSGAVALYMYQGGVTANITDTTFKGNTSSLMNGGAAVHAYAFEEGGIALSMVDDKILNNTAAGVFSAGGVEGYADNAATVAMHFDHDVISGNVGRGSEGTGGIQGYAYLDSASPLDVENSVFVGNRAPDGGYGGAVANGADDQYDNSTLTLTNDVLSHNSVGSATLGQEGYGGAVSSYDYAALIMTGCKVTDNTATGTASSGAEGGGVYDASYFGTMFGADVVTGNRVTGHLSEGGGIWTYPYDSGGVLVRSTVSSNFADYGAGVYVYGYTFSVDASTISRNGAGGGGTGGWGGGIYTYDSAISLTNSTIGGNLAKNSGIQLGEGGGIYIEDSSATTIYFTTISGNAAQHGAAIYNVDGSGTLRDSIVAANHTTLTGKAESDCFAAGRYEIFVSAGGNVLSRANCVLAQSFGDIVTARPGLLVLASNGGPTETMALVATSPAVNAAHGDCTTTDQRGVARPKTGRCDSGAYQRVATKKK
jgi:CSLREA domain-containing protein